MNILLEIFLWTYALISPENILLGHTLCATLLETTFCNNDYVILHSHQQCRTFQLSNPYQHFALSVFTMLAILVGVCWYLVTILICIFLMTNDVEHFFMYLLAIPIFSFMKYPFENFVQFFNWVVHLFVIGL